MKIISDITQGKIKTDGLFFAIFKNEKIDRNELFSKLSEETKKIISQFLKKEFKGEEGETKLLWLQDNSPSKVVFFGLGDKTKWNQRKNQLIPRAFVQYAKANKIESFTTSINQSLGNDLFLASRNFAINATMADFDFNRYKEKPEVGWPKIKSICLVSDEGKKDIEKGIKEGVFIGEETNLCRNLSNTPGGDMTPAKLAEAAKKAAKGTGLSVRIIEQKEMAKLHMGGILGVAQGSSEKPKLIIMEYKKGKKKEKPLALVGKGVTFDTGGLNLKSDQGIYEMHMDMSGGSAVIHGMAAIAKLKIPINAIGIIPAVENMPSGSSYRPGDLLKTMSGKTIEVLNTDAEGRIILADALYYGAKKYQPGLMVDFATLTGAALVALGNYCSALFTNKDKIQDDLIRIGNESGDYVWPLPLWDEYLSDIKGTFGDIANIGNTGRSGGAIHGAKFLEQFIDNTSWAHIDIAPRMTTTDKEFLNKGAAGFGVRYIVELAKRYPQIKL